MKHIMHEENTQSAPPLHQRIRKNALPLSILVSTLVLSGAILFATWQRPFTATTYPNVSPSPKASELEEQIMPSQGAALPAIWSDLGKQLTEAGVIDADALTRVHARRGTLTPEYENMLHG
jgi:hypothetical protein